MVSFEDGEGELWDGDRRLGRVSFHMDEYPLDGLNAGHHGDARTIPGIRNPPDGDVEPIDEIDLAALYYGQADLTLRVDGYALPCFLYSADGRLRGRGGWDRMSAETSAPSATLSATRGHGERDASRH